MYRSAALSLPLLTGFAAYTAGLALLIVPAGKSAAAWSMAAAFFLLILAIFCAFLSCNHISSVMRRMREDERRFFAMLAHDLKTPLTVMRLRAEGITDKTVHGRLVEDLEDMGMMIDAVLSGPSGFLPGEDRVSSDAPALLRKMAEEISLLGVSIQLVGAPSLFHPLRPIAFGRIVRNLLDNAARFASEIIIDYAADGQGMTVRIMDNGPGLAQEKRAALSFLLPCCPQERAFPFWRPCGERAAFELPASTASYSSQGTGLGLLIAHRLLVAQGGRLTLENRQEGGLAATIFLPFEETAAAGASA